MSKITILIFLTLPFVIFTSVTAQTTKLDSVGKLKEPDMIFVEGGTYTMGLIKEEANLLKIYMNKKGAYSENVSLIFCLSAFVICYISPHFNFI